MAAFASAATGNANDGATWGNTSPGIGGIDWPNATGVAGVGGDTVTVSTHTITVPASTTMQWGSSPNNVTVYDTTISSTGKIVVATGAILYSYGNVTVTNGGEINTNGTGRFLFNAVDSGDNTRQYRLRGGSAGGFIYRANGTDKDNLAEMGAVSPGYWYQEPTGGTTLAGLLDITYGKFSRMWDKGTPAISAKAWIVQRGSAGVAATVNYLVLDADCRFITMSDSGSGRSASFTDVYCKSATDGRVYGISWGGFGASNTGTMTRCVIWGDPFSDSGNVTVTECIYMGGNNNGYYGASSKWNAMLFAHTSGTGPGTLFSAPSATQAAVISSDQIAFATGAVTNTHFLGASASSGNTNNTETGRIYAVSNNDTVCDGFEPGVTTASNTQRCHHALFLPNTSGNCPGTAVSMLGNAQNTIEVEQCTMYGSGTFEGGCRLGENYVGHASMLNKLQNVLIEDHPNAVPPDTGAGLLFTVADSSVADKLNVAGTTGHWVSSTNYTGADIYSTTGGTQTPPSVATVLFAAQTKIDNRREMKAWAAWWGTRLGLSGVGTTSVPGNDATIVNAVSLFRNVYEQKLYTGTDMVQLACQYLRRGHIPRNTAGRAAGTGGATAGVYSAWLPTLSAPSCTAAGVCSITCNIADGTLYWVDTTSSTAPDWDRVIAGKDHTGATATASGSQACTGVGVNTITSTANLSNGVTYYRHVVHKALYSTSGATVTDDYLHTSDPVAGGASFTFAAAGANVAGRGSVRMLQMRRGYRRVA